MRTVYGHEFTFDELRHVHIIGATGGGKTTFLKSLILDHILAGDTVAVLDPHGELVKDLLDYIPPSRTNEVAYFDMHSDFPIGLNPLSDQGPDHLVVDSILTTFKGIWREVWGPRMNEVLSNALFALRASKSPCMLDLMPFLTDDRFRAKILSTVKNELVVAYWTERYASLNKKDRMEWISPVLDKVSALTTPLPLQAIFGQREPRFSVQEFSERGGIFLANLSKGVIGHERSPLVGSFLVGQFELAVFKRKSRKPIYLFIDEFQNFRTDALASILSESRKYGLALILAHQYLNQVPPVILDAVFGNVGTMIALRIGKEDEEALSKHFGARLSDIPAHHAWVKTTDSHLVSIPLKDYEKYGRADIIRRTSQGRFGAKP